MALDDYLTWAKQPHKLVGPTELFMPPTDAPMDAKKLPPAYAYCMMECDAFQSRVRIPTHPGQVSHASLCATFLWSDDERRPVDLKLSWGYCMLQTLGPTTWKPPSSQISNTSKKTV